MLEDPARARYDLASLRTGTCGGAEADPAVLADCARAFPMPELCQVYGQTEGSTLFACPSADDPERLTSAGPPLPGYQLRITDPETRAPLAPGQTGQIEARGPMVMRGYHAMPEATAACLDANGWLQTGDLGRLDGAGRLVLAGGRLRDMIIRGGENIYPAEIEAVLRDHPAVAEAAVFARPDRYYGETVAAALRLSGPVAAAALRDHCAARIAGFKVPAAWFAVTGFPMTASGKIQKFRLREMAAENALEVLP
jgi:fatty-acyl-CoA synthase